MRIVDSPFGLAVFKTAEEAAGFIAQIKELESLLKRNDNPSELINSGAVKPLEAAKQRA